ncbi:MAG: Mur ligase family protein, partial [Acidobacteria bacterium]|nr:Mur ligase family protein [Acidobacteriota bacterium]
LFPALAVITNIDHEHIDTYPSIDSLKDAYIQFANRVPFYGVVIACGDDYHTREAVSKFKRKTVTFGLLPGADWCGERVSTDINGETFNIWKNSKDKQIVRIPQKGTHNILNALASLAAASEMDIPLQKAAEALASFPGVDRRFQFLGREGKIDFYDDYAHHPSELKALIETARIVAGNRRIVIAFQPHRFTRLKAFEDAFAKVLLQSDLLFITEVYSAAEPPIPGISGEALYKRIKELGHSNCHYIPNVSDMAQQILPFLNENDLVITAGAGNITTVCPQIISLLKGKE